MGLFSKTHSEGKQKVVIDVNERRASVLSPASKGVKDNLPPPLNFYGKQIEELLLKVIRIENACLGKDTEKPDEIDEFVEIKKELYCIVMATKQLIREKYKIQTEHGNNVEAIQKGSTINKNLESMNTKFIQLKEVFKRQTRKAGKTISPDELDVRFKEMQVIKRQIEDCKSLVKKGTEFSEEEVITLTDFLSQMELAGVAPPQEFDAGGGGGWREPTAEEQSAMDRWAARDKDFDAQIWAVGKVVDNLHDIAVEIGEKAEEQGKMALELSRQADEANQEVIEVNAKLKKLVGSGNGINFCCKLVLTLILVAMIGYIAQHAVSRVKAAAGLSQAMRISTPPGGGYLGDSNISRLSVARTGGTNEANTVALIEKAMNGVVHGTNIPWGLFENLVKVDK